MNDPPTDPVRLAAAVELSQSTSASGVIQRTCALAAGLLEVPIVLAALRFGGQPPICAIAGAGAAQRSAANLLVGSFMTAALPLIIAELPGTEHSTDPVLQELGAGALCAVPLTIPEASAVGYLAAVDTAPRPWSGRDSKTLAQLGASLAAQAQELDLRRGAEHETARMSRTLATIVNQSEDAIITKDRTATISTWNRGAENLYGYTAQEAVGHPISMLLPPERAGEDLRLLTLALAGQAIPSFETTRLRKDRKPVHVSISVTPLLDETGQAVGASVIARDISSRVRVELSRRETMQRLRTAIDHAPIGVGLIDLRDPEHGPLLEMNAALRGMLGASAAGNGPARTLIAAVHPDDAEGLRADLLLLGADQGASIEREVRWAHPGGNQTWVLLSAASVPEASGRSNTAVLHALDIDARKRFEGQLRHLADHDALTGLFNRRRFQEELRRAQADAARRGSSGAVLMIDLDGFKRVNDTLGHGGGDVLLAQIGQLLRSTLRETDVVGRVGGDEFAAILPDTSTEQAQFVSRKLLEAVAEHGNAVTAPQDLRVSASIGINAYGPDPGISADEVLIGADTAMYLAKAAGKNQSALHDPAIAPTAVAGSQTWLGRLRAAIAEEGFALLAQPIRGLRAPEPTFYELLLRMRGGDGELIAPGVFMYHAERFGLAPQLDLWVFEQALKLLVECESQAKPLTLAINMSAKTLGAPGLVESLGTMLASYPSYRHGSLVVEFTETAAIADIETAREVSDALRALGCKVALDDFGVGFSSFFYLKRLRFDYLKIDGEFVRSMPSNVADQLVVSSMVEIARGLGAATIAEFVGSHETALRLTELGVDYGQGYHFGGPQPIADTPGLKAR